MGNKSATIKMKIRRFLKKKQEAKRKDLSVFECAEIVLNARDKDFFHYDNPQRQIDTLGVLVDDPKVECRNRADVALNGGCKADLSYSGFTVSRVYARHTSELNVTACGSAHVTIDIFDEVKLSISVIGTKARVLVNVYGNAQVQCTGSAKIVNKNQATY